MRSRRDFFKTALFGGAAASMPYLANGVPSAPSMVSGVDRRPFGRIRTPVSILGLGLGSSYNSAYDADPAGTQDLLWKALDHGINVWDTSRGYGPSEARIGPIIAERRSEIYLVTKSRRRDYDGFLQDVEISLGNLHTDYLDLLHIWNLPANADLDEIERGALRAVMRLKDEKVIRHFGISGHSGATVLMEAMRRFDPDAVLTVFPCTRDDSGRYEDELLPLARARGMGVLAMKMVRRARNADLRGADLIRYAVGLDGVHCGVVGVDTEAHLMENIRMATNFEPLNSHEQALLRHRAGERLAHIPTPWEQPGYQDGQVA